MSPWWAAVVGAGLVLGPSLVYLVLLRSRIQAAAAELTRERDRADVSERQLAYLTALGGSFIDQAAAAMLLVDGSRRVSYFNAAAARLFRIRGGLVEGKTLIELVGDHDLDSMIRR